MSIITKKRLKQLLKEWEAEFNRHQADEQAGKPGTFETTLSRYFKIIALGRTSMLEELLEEYDI
jgi:hypothetical protein